MTEGKRVTLREVPAAWRKREPFNANGSLRGISYADSQCMHMTGRLIGDDCVTFLCDTAKDDIAYLVVSYSTPIAWVRRDGTEYRVSQKFSATTSRHMGRLY